MDRQSTPVGSQVRKLLIATLALVACRVVSQWDNLFAVVAAATVILVLAVSIAAGMPRLRRVLPVLLVAILPIATLANALAFALSAFIMLLGAQGLLADGSIGFGGPPWNLAFGLVPLAAAANLVWLARANLAWRWLRCVWLANLASAGYSAWVFHWCMAKSPERIGFPPPAAIVVLLGLAIVSLAALALDTRAQAQSSPPNLGRARRRLVPATALLVFVALGPALFPVYRKRQVARSLEQFGMYAHFGIVFPGWRAPVTVPFSLYDYLGEISGVAARRPGLPPDAFKGDADHAGRMLKSLPWLEFVAVNQLPEDGERILQPLAGHARLHEVALIGAGVTDETLADTARIPGLNRAAFHQARITDAGLANLAGATWLQSLSFYQTPISGDGLVHLRSLPRLSQLNLTGTNVGDRQLAELAGFKALASLWLDHTQVTDEGLPSLARCKTLKLIDLSGTAVTKNGVDQLRRALPTCEVVWPEE